MNYFKQNLKILQPQRPDLLPSLNKKPENLAPSSHQAGNTDTPLNELTFEHKSLIFLLGMGTGNEAKQIVTKFPKSRLIIIEPDADLFTLALKEADQSSLIVNNKVTFHFGANLNIPQILQQEDDCLRALPFHLVINKHLQAILPDLYNPIYNTLQTALLSFKAKVQTIIKQGPLLPTTAERNFQK